MDVHCATMTEEYRLAAEMWMRDPKALLEVVRSVPPDALPDWVLQVTLWMTHASLTDDWVALVLRSELGGDAAGILSQAQRDTLFRQQSPAAVLLSRYSQVHAALVLPRLLTPLMAALFSVGPERPPLTGSAAAPESPAAAAAGGGGGGGAGGGGGGDAVLLNRYEVAPAKLPAGANLKANQDNLLELVRLLVDSVQSRALNSVPNGVRRLYMLLGQVLTPALGREDARRFMVSIFYLRFINPAIVAPDIHGMLNHAPTPAERRLSLLISKAVQAVGNGVLFGEKEPMFNFLNPLIMELVPTALTFMDSFASASRPFSFLEEAQMFRFSGDDSAATAATLELSIPLTSSSSSLQSRRKLHSGTSLDQLPRLVKSPSGRSQTSEQLPRLAKSPSGRSQQDIGGKSTPNIPQSRSQVFLHGTSSLQALPDIGVSSANLSDEDSLFDSSNTEADTMEIAEDLCDCLSFVYETLKSSSSLSSELFAQFTDPIAAIPGVVGSATTRPMSVASIARSIVGSSASQNIGVFLAFYPAFLTDDALASIAADRYRFDLRAMFDTDLGETVARRSSVPLFLKQWLLNDGCRRPDHLSSVRLRQLRVLLVSDSNVDASLREDLLEEIDSLLIVATGVDPSSNPQGRRPSLVELVPSRQSPFADTVGSTDEDGDDNGPLFSLAKKGQAVPSDASAWWRVAKPAMLAHDMIGDFVVYYQRMMPHHFLYYYFTLTLKDPEASSFPPAYAKHIVPQPDNPVQGVQRCVQRIATWSVSRVLLAAPEDRDEVIEFLIRVARLCSKREAHNVAYAVLMGLQHRTVQTLREAWGTLDRQVNEIYESLCSRYSVVGDFALYRKALAQAHAPDALVMPLLATSFRDIEKAMGNDELLSSTGLISFAKLALLLPILRNTMLLHLKAVRMFDISAVVGNSSTLLRTLPIVDDAALEISSEPSFSARARLSVDGDVGRKKKKKSDSKSKGKGKGKGKDKGNGRDKSKKSNSADVRPLLEIPESWGLGSKRAYAILAPLFDHTALLKDGVLSVNFFGRFFALPKAAINSRSLAGVTLVPGGNALVLLQQLGSCVAATLGTFVNSLCSGTDGTLVRVAIGLQMLSFLGWGDVAVHASSKMEANAQKSFLVLRTRPSGDRLLSCALFRGFLIGWMEALSPPGTVMDARTVICSCGSARLSSVRDGKDCVFVVAAAASLDNRCYEVSDDLGLGGDHDILANTGLNQCSLAACEQFAKELRAGFYTWMSDVEKGRSKGKQLPVAADTRTVSDLLPLIQEFFDTKQDVFRSDVASNSVSVGLQQVLLLPVRSISSFQMHRLRTQYDISLSDVILSSCGFALGVAGGFQYGQLAAKFEVGRESNKLHTLPFALRVLSTMLAQGGLGLMKVDWTRSVLSGESSKVVVYFEVENSPEMLEHVHDQRQRGTYGSSSRKYNTVSCTCNLVCGVITGFLDHFFDSLNWPRFVAYEIACAALKLDVKICAFVARALTEKVVKPAVAAQTGECMILTAFDKPKKK